MRKLCLLLCALLALAGCAAVPQAGTEPPAEELALAVLEACGRETGSLERLDQTLEKDGLTAYLTNYYGLEEENWSECAVYRAGGGDAFEVAVLRLSDGTDLEKTLEGLRAYLTAREGDFTGYAPEQAAMVHSALAAGQGRYAALLLCQEPELARDAFYAAFDAGQDRGQGGEDASRSAGDKSGGSSSGARSVMGPASQTEPAPNLRPDPSAKPIQELNPGPGSTSRPAPPDRSDPSRSQPEQTPAVEYPGRTPYVRPGIDDMTIYDTGAILTAWREGGAGELSQLDRDILEKASQVLAQNLTEGMGDYEKERALYGWLVTHASYDQDHYDPLKSLDPNAFNPYGPLVGGKGVCLGFATAFQLLMDMAEVECITVVGAAYMSREDHAWNMVRLDGEWYCVDPTWDLGLLFWRYFNVTSDWMARTDHQWDYANVPEAAAEGHGQPGL